MAVSYLQTACCRRVAVVALAVVTTALNVPQAAVAQDPVIDRVAASNLRPGQIASVVVTGKQLTGAMSLWTPAGVLRPKDGQDLSKDQPVTMEGAISADVVPGIYPVRMVTNHGCSEAAFVVVDDLPSVAIAAESDDRKTGQLITLPCCIDGQINPVLSKFFRIAMTAGQTVSVEVFARRLGSDLDPVIRVTGPDGNEVAYRDDLPGAEGDTQLQFTAATDGEYRVEIRDVRYSGGARHFFHLRLGKLLMVTSVSPRIAMIGHPVSLIGTTGEILGEATPSGAPETTGSLIPVLFRAAESDASALSSVLLTNQPTLPETEPNDDRAAATSVPAETQVLTGVLQKKGDVDWFKLTATEAMPLLVTTHTREVSSPTDVMLELFNAEGGKIVENDDAGPRDAELAAQLPAAGEFFLKVSEIAGRGGPAWVYALDVYQGRKSIRVTAPVDHLNIPRGGSAAMPLTVRRIHYDGPLKVEAVGLPAAIQMAPFWLGAKQSTAPVVLTATDPAAASSDADWAPVSFKITTPEGSMLPPAEFQLAPPAPKKQDSEIFRSARLRTDLFAAVQPVAQFSFIADPATVTVAQGATVTVTIRSTRAADWTMPIEIALATPADQLPPGMTVTAGSMAAGELAITITAAADAAVGPFSVFLQGKAKKDNVEPIHPVPAIVVEVKAP
ncbi:MAG: PPC domain-containing protein [Fuerstia sp.]|nr:PPC domain-containing protein [Fuerstiella sp.]